MRIERLLLGVSASAGLPGLLPFLASLRGSVCDELWIVATPAATRIVPARTIATVVGARVEVDGWGTSGSVPHVEMTRWATELIVLPASANTLAKFAQGMAPDLLSLCFVQWTRSALLVPLLSDAMSASAAVQRNIAQLRADGHHVDTDVTRTTSLSDRGEAVPAVSPADLRRRIVQFARCTSDVRSA